MEDLKQSKKAFSKLGWCYIIGTVAVNVLQILVEKVVFPLKPEWEDNISITLIISCLIVYGCGMPLIVFFAKKMPAKAPEPKKMKWWQFVLALIIGYSMTYLSNLVGTLLTMVIGFLKGSPVRSGLLETVTGGNMFVNLVAMVIVAPIVEEYVFRKLIIDRTRQYGQGMAIAASAVMFGLFHGNLNQFAYAVVLGAFFGFLYLKTGKLQITIGMHAIVNFMGGIIAPFLLEKIEINKLMEMDLYDQALFMEYIMDNLLAWMVFLSYVFLLMGVVLAGFVLFIVFIKRFKLDAGPDDVPKGKRFQVLFGNPGMITFCVIWVILIILQLFM